MSPLGPATFLTSIRTISATTATQHDFHLDRKSIILRQALPIGKLMLFLSFSEADGGGAFRANYDCDAITIIIIIVGGRGSGGVGLAEDC